MYNLIIYVYSGLGECIDTATCTDTLYIVLLQRSREMEIYSSMYVYISYDFELESIISSYRKESCIDPTCTVQCCYITSMPSNATSFALSSHLCPSTTPQPHNPSLSVYPYATKSTTSPSQPPFQSATDPCTSSARSRCGISRTACWHPCPRRASGSSSRLGVRLRSLFGGGFLSALCPSCVGAVMEGEGEGEGER